MLVGESHTGEDEARLPGNAAMRHWPPWLMGIFAGTTLWILAILTHPLLRVLERRYDFFAEWLPAWIMRMGWFGLDIDYLQEYVERATSPVSGEWLAKDSVLGLCLYSLIGAAVFCIFSMARGRRFSVRTLLFVVTLLALLLGLAVGLFK